MQRVHLHAQPRPEARQCLRGQADLRHQHQRLPAARQTGGDGVQIDLGLARAGHALQQDRGEALRGDGGYRRLLFVIEHRAGLGIARAAARRLGETLGQAALQQTARGGAPAGVEVVELPFGQAFAAQALGQQARLAAGAQAVHRGHAGLGQAPAPGLAHRQRLAMAQRAGQGGGQHLAQRGVGVGGQPLQRARQLAGQQRSRIQHGQRGAQFARGGAGGDHLDHHTDQFAIAERHAHPPADIVLADGVAGGRQVVEGLPQGNGQGDAEQRGGHRGQV
ncbi:hypothetical protein QE386_003541 [Pseudoxanthomonas winnipegensis]|nr:hypothetical protein [Pseudoxanthomonas winnipegensis]